MNQPPLFELRHLGNDNFVLFKDFPSKGYGALSLTANEILELARRLPQFSQQVLAIQNPSVAGVPGYEMTVAPKVREARVNHDLMGTAVTLQFQDEFDLISGFALSPVLAMQIGQHLLIFAEKVASNNTNKQ